MTEGVLNAIKSRPCNNHLIEEVRKSWKIEVWNVEEEYVEAFDDYWSRIVIFRFPDKLNFREIFEFNSLNIDKDKFFSILQKLDPNLFMVVKQVVIINNGKEYMDFIENLEGDSSTAYYQGADTMGEHLFNESHVIIYMEAIRKAVKEECEAWPHVNEKTELNRVFWQTLLHELRHTVQSNPLFENEFEDMDEEEKEQDAENYCRKIFQEVVIQNDYWAIY